MPTDWSNLSFGAPRRFGRSEKRVKTDERDGSVAGHEVEHWDDSRDAHAIVKAPTVKARRHDP